MTELPIYSPSKEAPGKGLANRAARLRELPAETLLAVLEARRRHVARESLRLTGAAERLDESGLLGSQLEALAFVEQAASKVAEPTFEIIRKTHRMANPGASGEFRETEVSSQFANARPSPARFVESKLENLLLWLSGESGRGMYPAERMALWFPRFVEIAPFEGGNFRTAHLLLSHFAAHHGFPPVTLRFEDSDAIRADVERAMLFDTGALVVRFSEALASALQACEEGAESSATESGPAE